MNAALFLPARDVANAAVPWVPLGADKAFKPLRFFRDNRGFVELLRLQPGAVIPLHRHTGEVHAFNLQGSRRICTGEIVGPGGYVHEPAGNTDSWQVHGEEELVVMVVVMGAVEYLADDGHVSKRYSADTLLEIYREFCRAQGIDEVDLID